MSTPWRWLADLRVSVCVMTSHRGCDQIPWVRSDGWFCGGCGTRWGLDGRITPRMSPHTAHTRWPRPAAWGRLLDAVRAVARGIGLWWGHPWCPTDPDECGRVTDVEHHLATTHHVAPWRRP